MKIVIIKKLKIKKWTYTKKAARIANEMRYSRSQADGSRDKGKSLTKIFPPSGSYTRAKAFENGAVCL